MPRNPTVPSVALALTAALAIASALPARAATALADAPVFAVPQAPGNVALVLSVEYPTVVSVAYIDRNYNAAGADYLGYFDPNKCYDYSANSADKPSAPNTTAAGSYFVPMGKATSSSGTAPGHLCSGQWSGNFLNWASMQTIDAFRSIMTGGYRVIDTPSLSIIEKAWASGQGGTSNFPDGSIKAADIPGATPFASLVTAGAKTLQFRIQGLGNQMRFFVAKSVVTYNVSYYNFTGTCTNANFSTCTAIVPTPSTVTDFSAVQANTSPYPPSVNQNNFGARYTTSITVPTTGTYNFRMLADDGARLYLNGSSTALLTTASYNQTISTTAATAVTLTAGDTLSVQLDYYQGVGGAGISVDWQLPNGSWFALGHTVDNYQFGSIDYAGGQAVIDKPYSLFIRAKVCDNGINSGGLEANCVAYSQGSKPQGLIQSYANKLRFSAFGYLNDSNYLRDAGVLRARQKFVGPTQPVPGAPPVANMPNSLPGQTTGAEWDATTGVYIDNPDAADASATNTTFATSIGNSGVTNYLNRFGELVKGDFKGNDPVSELYYAAIRYFKNLGNVKEWTDMTGASQASINTFVDGFPVITAWDDPILYSCQKNFVLGIGDVNTHTDKNLPGNTNNQREPSLPKAVSDDATVNTVSATSTVGKIEGMGTTLGTTSPGGDANSYLMAGLAYYYHVNDVRPEKFLPTSGQKQPANYSTIDTYWVDVQEGQKYANNNQFYLATKYGGFTVPSGYNYGDALPLSSWYNSTNVNGSNFQPDNYFSGARPDLMKAGLTAAFADIASKNKAVSTAFSTALSQVGTASNATYASQYDAATWTGEVTAGELSFNSDGNPVATTRWTLAALLKSQVGSNTGWNLNRRVVTWNPTTLTGVPFRANTIDTDQLAALGTGYVSGNDSSNFLNYLRGDQSNEKGSTTVGSTAAYRARVKLLGDVVDSKVRVVGPPSFPYLDGTNPGYSTFKSKYASRKTVIYFGTNDGLLHAVNGDLASPASTTPGPGGNELFAYVPSALFKGPNGTPRTDGLASLGNSSFSHHFMVDATPAQYDLDFSRTPGASGGADWRSVLIGGLGKGGRGYYAIDVTDSDALVNAAAATTSTADDVANEQIVAKKVLWEFNASPTVPLGYSFGDPIVAKTKKWGWVVVLPSGYNNSDGIGRLFLVNPRTGALLETLSTGVGSTSNDAGLAQVNSFINDSTDGTVDSLYAGDLLGNLWRFDLTALSGSYPAPTLLAKLTDSNGVAQPVTTAPALAVDPLTRKRFVLVGTGRLLDSTDIASTQQQTFYAVVDGSDARFNAAADLPKGPPPVTFPITRATLYNNVSSLDNIPFNQYTQAGWYEDLDTGSSGWRVIKNPATLAGAVAFSTTRPDSTNVCSPGGTSRLYGRAFGTTSTILQTPSAVGNPPAVDTPFYAYPDVISDQQLFSVSGTTKLVIGTPAGLDSPNLKPPSTQQLRRMNWRELRVVD